MKRLALFLMLAFMALLPGAFAQAPTPALSGNWTGTLSVGETALPLVCHFTPKPDGSLAATFDSPDQGAMGLPFSAAKATGQTVHLEAASIGGSFDGTLDAAGKTLTGNWKQGGASLPLTLTRTSQTSSAAPALNRPQEPHPPFPYTVRDVTFPGGAAGVTLAGTLTLPTGAGPFPAVVLIAGSGRVDRDETAFGHKLFLLLADTLTRRGIAVLRYDKRGVSQSTGSYALATTLDFAADTRSAVAYLRSQPEINPHKIGLLGHSEGGVIAPLVASQHPSEIAFVVLLAGPGINGEKILLAQQVLAGKAEGARDADIQKNATVSKKVFDLDAQEPNPAVFQAKAQKIILAALTPEDKLEVGDPLQFAQKQIHLFLSPWFRYFLTYDPRPALEKTRCPVLALDGSKDLQVPPAEDLAAIGSALSAGGNVNITIRELPHLNHLFQTCTTGSPSEYAKIPETMAPILLTTVGDWIAAQTH